MHDLRAGAPEPPAAGVAAAAFAEIVEAVEVDVTSGPVDSPRYLRDDVRQWTARLRTELRHPFAAARKLAARVLETLLPSGPGHPRESH